MTHGTNEVRLVVPAGTSDGKHRLRLTVCDPQIPGLCTTTETATITVGQPPVADPPSSPGQSSQNQTMVSSPGAGAAGSPASARLRARTTLRLTGATTTRHAGQLTITTTLGHKLRSLSGRLSTQGATGPGEVILMDPAGHPVAKAASSDRGRWELGPVRVTKPGVWRLVFRTTGGHVQVGQITAILKPTILIKPVYRSGVVRVDGTVAPRVGGKQVVLEWFNSLDGKWRTAVIGRTTSNGRFGLIYRFQNRAIAAHVHMRVTAPTEVGIPLTTASSRSFVPTGR